MAALLAVLRGSSQPRPKSKHKSESLPSQQFEQLTIVHNHMAALLRDPEPVEWRQLNVPIIFAQERLHTVTEQQLYN